MPKVFFITGVSGSGKTTIGKALAQLWHLPFYDADDFHPQANIQKMSSGIPLTDEDRWPWLHTINRHAANALKAKGGIYACSALKHIYRSALVRGLEHQSYDFIHLHGSFHLIYQRLSDRSEHFMPIELLKSQFDTYEGPHTGLRVDIDQPLETMIIKINHHFMRQKKSALGVVGLGVMGTALARNISRNGHSISLYNRHVIDIEMYVAKEKKENYAEFESAEAFDDIAAFIQSLERPKKIILMINAGRAVDDVIDQLVPLLDKGDLIIDGGNSHFRDTERRSIALQRQGILYIGCGISGGEEGALIGPSMMPAGSPEGYNMIAEVFNQIAAKNKKGMPCVAYIGSGGSGHFVKMVHNGIEYAEMQMIGEIYSLCRYGLGMHLKEVADLLESWNVGIDESYLLGITVDILRSKDDQGRPVVERILDMASNKGTGAWTTIAAAELGVAIPTMTAALYSRFVSSYKDDRIKRSEKFTNTSTPDFSVATTQLLHWYRLSRLLNHEQGFSLIAAASQRYEWYIDLPSLAQVWSAGCIIQSALLPLLGEAIAQHQDLLQSAVFIQSIEGLYADALQAYQVSAHCSVPIPCLSSAMEYLKASYKSTIAAASLIQAQRDYFGAHTFHWVDDPYENVIHWNWKNTTL